ncbi:oligosaccharide flippase family protein [Glaciecola sp. MH2013]|uniref:oligosaccharide flippase family protein n=1 Tax=Glaciecola sp. MH2013 TaxID=2785524 RepID=UPI00189DC632|nr:oligosaccharide flippase family protein [Glaciecola sp. MH2013]MBF7072159.1 oligosaccharide flippase family protein [Glaciecola sp. MH2013]
MSALKKGILSSVILVGESLLNKLVGLVSTLILARVLLPEDFGIVAVGTLFIGFFEVISSIGASQYLLREKKITDQDVNTAFSINFLLRTILTLIVVGLSFVINGVFEDDRIQGVVLGLAIIFLSESFQNPGIIYLKRNQEYAKIVKVTLSGKVLAVISAVSIALLYQSYWALVIGHAINRLSMLVGYYLIYPYLPKFELVKAKKQWMFSIWMLPQSILGFFRTQLDTFLTATYFGQAQLGSYHTMKYIAFIPTSHLMIPLTQPLLVELRKASSNVKEFSKIFNASFILALIVAAPLSFFVLVFHELTTQVLLGENWLEFSELMGVFCVLVTTTVLSLQCSKTLIVFDKPNHLLIYEVVSFVVIYTILIFSGFDNIIEFAKIRIWLEVLTIFMLLVYVSLRYTSIIHFGKLISAMFAIGFCAWCSVAVVDFFGVANYTSNAFINLCLSSLSVSILYGLQLVLGYLLVFKSYEECFYLKSLFNRAIQPISNRLFKA